MGFVLCVDLWRAVIRAAAGVLVPGPGVRVSMGTRHGGRPWRKFCAVPQGSNIMRDDMPSRQNASHGFFGAKTVTWFFGYRENR